MKLFMACVVFLAGLISAQNGSHAIWVRFTDTELIDQSDIIVSAELIGEAHLRVAPDRPILTLAVLLIEEVLKGRPGQRVVLLALPSPEAPRSSIDLFYRTGQKGLWFLRARSTKEGGIYLADHPQRFISAQRTDRIEAIRRTLNTKSGAQ